MNYQKAKDIRGKKFSELMTDKLVAGDGIVSSFAKTISERSKARSTGLKEKFDPLNIAKVLTGGSRLGPALLGKMTGASKERMSYFAGDPKKKKIEALASGIKPESLEMATTSLGNIYELLKKDKEEKKLQRELSYSKEEEQEFEEDRRNQELIKALTARVKPRKKKKVEEKKAEEPEKPKEPEKPTPTVKGKGKAPTKTTEKPTAPEAPKPTAPPATKPTAPAKAPPKLPEAKPPTAKPVSKPEAKPPTAVTAPKPTVKPPAEKIKPPVITGGDKGIMNMIKQHEGAIPYPYKDSKGLWTIGVGHLIGDGKSLPPEYESYKNNGGPYDKKNNKTPALTEAEMEALFIKDFESHKKKP